MYKFYVKNDGKTYGPYSAKEVRDLQLIDDILVTEESMSEWLPAGRFDFDDMVKKELGASVNEDGTISRSRYDTSMNPVRPVTHTPQSAQPKYTSTYADAVPNEIKGWNWGAFFFSWFWGVCNGVYWPLALIGVEYISYVGALIFLDVSNGMHRPLELVAVNYIPFVSALIYLGVCIALGINGSEWAWKGKTWSSVAEFKRVQHKWAIAIVWCFGIFIALSILGVVIGIVIAIGLYE